MKFHNIKENPERANNLAWKNSNEAVNPERNQIKGRIFDPVLRNRKQIHGKRRETQKRKQT